MTESLTILDTTLRDGEQSPGVSLNAEDKLQIAHQLARLKVDVIEAGFPHSSPGDFAAVKAIAEQVEGPVIAGLSRCFEADVRASAAALEPAARARIHVFIGTSPIHREGQLRMTQREVYDHAVQMTSLAKSFREDVEFSPMDASRTERDYLAEIVNGCIEAGATTINLPDTVGYATPDEWRDLIAWMYLAGACVARRRALGPLPQRSRTRHRKLACQRARRGATDRDVRQRHRRARRQRRARRGRDGNTPASGGVRRHHATRSLAAVPHVAPGIAAHRHARAAQQVGGGRQRVRAPLRHPPGRHAQGPPDVRDHGAGSGRCGIDARARQAERASRAPRSARAARVPSRRRGVAACLRALQGAGGPQARRHGPRPRGDRRRRAPGERGDFPARASAGELRHQPARQPRRFACS